MPTEIANSLLPDPHDAVVAPVDPPGKIPALSEVSSETLAKFLTEIHNRFFARPLKKRSGKRAKAGSREAAA